MAAMELELYSEKHSFLSKREVKMAVYSPRNYFFCVTMDRDNFYFWDCSKWWMLYYKDFTEFRSKIFQFSETREEYYWSSLFIFPCKNKSCLFRCYFWSYEKRNKKIKNRKKNSCKTKIGEKKLGWREITTLFGKIIIIIIIIIIYMEKLLSSDWLR